MEAALTGVVDVATENVRATTRRIQTGRQALRAALGRGNAGYFPPHHQQSQAEKILDGAYRFLGAKKGDPISVIQAKYRERVKELHPDTGGDEEEFKLLQLAYERVKADIGSRR